MSSVPQRRPQYRPHYTVDDYRQWEGDWELWTGTAVSLGPSPFGVHGYVCIQFGVAIVNAINEVDCNASVLSEVDWIIADDQVVRPDVSVLCGPPPEGHILRTPALVAEILSESTRTRDLDEKHELYRQMAVPWYFAIDPDDRAIQIWHLDTEGDYQSILPANEIAVNMGGDCRLTLDLSHLFPKT